MGETQRSINDSEMQKNRNGKSAHKENYGKEKYKGIVYNMLRV